MGLHYWQIPVDLPLQYRPLNGYPCFRVDGDWREDQSPYPICASDYALFHLCPHLEVKRGREPVTWIVDVLARIFSGVYYPLSVLPGSVRWITWMIPHTYALRGIRQVMIKGAGFEDGNTMLMCAVLLVFCLASLILGIWMMNRALDQAERGNGVGIVV